MAADRGMREEESSVDEGTENTDGSHPPSKGICKKNGLTHGCHCSGKACRATDSKRSKLSKDGRVNGLNFSIPSLRSRSSATQNNGTLRSEKSTFLHDSPGRRRRSLRGSKHDCDDRHSPMGPVSEASNGSQSDSSNSDLVDTNSALVCSQPTDICNNVQTTLLGPISPDTSRSCTPPLSVSSTQSSASCSSLLACGPTLARDFSSNHVQLMDIGGQNDTGDKKLSYNNNNGSSSASSSTCSELLTSKCNGVVSHNRDNLYSLFPAATSRTALCSAGTSAIGSLRFGQPNSGNNVLSKINRSSSNSSNSSSCSTNGSSKNSKSSEVTCRWNKCSATVQDRDLMEHIRKEHVDTQIKKPPKDSSESTKYVCLWTGCKVYDRPSSSQTWLERHIISHSGDKPFQCIVDGCGQRFTSQSGLERHVNSHFNVCPPVKSCSSKGKDDTPSKLLKRKKLRRRKSWLIKTEDFFDSRVMETLRHQLIVFSEHTSLNNNTSSNPTTTVTFHSSVIARRTECSGKVKVLLRWTPKDILPDAWVLESQIEEMRQKTVPLSSLPHDTVDSLHPSIYTRHRYRKHRRK